MRYLGAVSGLAVTGIAFALFAVLSKPASPVPLPPHIEIPDAAAVPIEPLREAPVGWREYRNLRYGFSLFHPEGLVVAKHDEGGGAATITFEDANSLKGFQIFIVPYSGSQISEERFRLDVPSGVRKDLADSTIDGATGASFYSTNSFLGDTREVWFIRGGYLYELTTFKSLDTWLDDILGTWQFL